MKTKSSFLFIIILLSFFLIVSTGAKANWTYANTTLQTEHFFNNNAVGEVSTMSGNWQVTNGGNAFSGYSAYLISGVGNVTAVAIDTSGCTRIYLDAQVFPAGSASNMSFQFQNSSGSWINVGDASANASISSYRFLSASSNLAQFKKTNFSYKIHGTGDSWYVDDIRLTCEVATWNYAVPSLPYYFNRNFCPDNTDMSYVFCDNFQYSSEISNYGWINDNANLSPKFTYIPKAYSVGAYVLALNNTPVTHNVMVSFVPSNVGVSGFTYNGYNANAKSVRLGFDLVTFNNSNKSMQFGMSQTNSEALTDAFGDNDLLFGSVGWFTYGTGLYQSSSNAFWIFNFSKLAFEQVYNFSSFNRLVHIDMFVETPDDYVWDSPTLQYGTYYVRITDGNTIFTSKEYTAGFSDKEVVAQMYNPISTLDSIYFTGFQYDDDNTTSVKIDNVVVQIMSKAYSVDVHLLDCTGETLCNGVPCNNYSTRVPIVANLIVNSQAYTTDSQGYLSVYNLASGTYVVNASYAGVNNFYAVVSTQNSSVNELCFFTEKNETNVPDKSEDIFSNFFGSFGFGNFTTLTKEGLSCAIIIALILFLAFKVPSMSAVGYLIISAVGIAFFTAIKWIPFWIAMFIMIIFAGIIMLGIMSKSAGGQ
jgi:hypothetical protein